MSDILVYLEEAPPRCLAAFDAVPAGQEGDDYAAAATFALRCKACGGDTFHLRGITRVVKNGSRVHTGVRARCAHCGREETPIDATRSGHDGELGRLSHLAGEDAEERLHETGDEPLLVNVLFVYSIELDDLLDHARKRGLGPQDLFDHVSVSVRSESGTWREIWDFACA